MKPLRDIDSPRAGNVQTRSHGTHPMRTAAAPGLVYQLYYANITTALMFNNGVRQCD